MAKNKKKNGNKKSKERWHQGLRTETKQSIFAIFSFALGILWTLAAFGKAGMVGDGLQSAFEFLFGKAFFLVPLVFFAAGFSFLFSLRRHFVAATVIGGLLFLLSSLGIATIVFNGSSETIMTGGYVGYAASYPFIKLFDFWAALILLSAILIAGILIMLNISLWREKPDDDDEEESPGKPETVSNPKINLPVGAKPILPARVEENTLRQQADGGREIREASKAPQVLEKKEDDFISAPKRARRHASFLMPPLDLLEDDKGTPSSGDIKANANIIRRTLQNFGIEVEMAEVNVGPSVTQYTLKPAEGVKLAKITALQNDLALALAAHPLRIEAPIPGRSLVGIEIPNRSIALVGLRSLLSADEFQKTSLPLLFALGRDVSGRSTYADLARMPHILIAGATGTGKSVQIHGIMTSLLYRNSPETLRFIIIDPKRVELTAYSKLPHLLTPVIVEPKKALVALKWAVREMERRYGVLAENKVRDIGSFHANILSKDSEADEMPYIVVVIDELADLMALYPRELEAVIVRLAKMSRAVGIHLMLSTQRPSVEVITGLIKANITARIAFQVASGVDSRTILDGSGAERLLGNGDMLFLAGDVAKPRRVQGAFVSEKEVKRVTEWIEEHSEAESSGGVEDIFSGAANGASGTVSLEVEGDADDELYEEAKRLAIEAGKISASYMQRRLRVGYARAARLLDLMEERGVIGPADGAKPREVLIKGTEEARKIDAMFPKEAAPATKDEPSGASHEENFERTRQTKPKRTNADEERRDDFYNSFS